MTLTKYNGAYEELFSNCVLWWTGSDQTITGFPILPSGVTVTPNGTWLSTDLGNSKILKSFQDGCLIALSDNSNFEFGSGNWTICMWIQHSGYDEYRPILCHGYNSGTTRSFMIYLTTLNEINFAQSTTGSNNNIATISWTHTYTSWNFISLVRSGSVIQFRANMVQFGSDLTAYTLFDTSSDLIIGSDNSTGIGTELNGSIKDLIIFKGLALDLPTLTTLMRKTHPTAAIGDFRPTLSGIRGVE